MPFAKLTREEVLAALTEYDENNPIVREITRIIEKRTVDIAEAVKSGGNPEAALACGADAPAIDHIACDLLRESIENDDDDGEAPVYVLAAALEDAGFEVDAESDVECVFINTVPGFTEELVFDFWFDLSVPTDAAQIEDEERMLSLSLVLEMEEITDEAIAAGGFSSRAKAEAHAERVRKAIIHACVEAGLLPDES